MCFQILKRDFDSSRQVHRQQQVEKRGWKRRERRNVSWETHRRREHVARGRPLAYLQGGWILSVFSLTRNHKKPVWHTCMTFLNMLMIVTVLLVIPHVLKCGKGVTMMESITKTHKTTGYSKILCVIWAQGYDQLDASLWHPSLRTTRRMLRTIQPFRCAFLGQSWNC